MDNIISVKDLDLYYGEKHALHKINMDIRKKLHNRTYRSIRLWKINFP